MKKRILPQNLESEKIVLGSMIEDTDQIQDIIVTVKQKFFYDPNHQKIFGIIKRLYEADASVDSVVVFESSESQHLNLAAAQINDLCKYGRSIKNAIYHSRVVIEKFILRELISKAQETIKYAFNPEEDVFDLVNGSISDLQQTMDILNNIKEDINLTEKLDDIFTSIKDERDGIISPSLKTINHPTFNRCTGGIRPGNIIAISGKYKQGKTTFATSLISDYAIEQNKKIGWFSLEVNEYEMSLKFISMNTKTRYNYLRDPANKNNDNEFRYSYESLQETVSRAKEKFESSQIYVNDSELDIHGIINKLKIWKKKHGIDIAVIDYIGLIENSSKSERRDLEIAELSRRLKRASGSLEIPIFILSQENEEGKTADSKALLRDADFWFSTSNLSDNGMTTWKIEDGEGRWAIHVDAAMFEIKNKGNRHGLSGTRILYRYNADGSFCEVNYKKQNNVQV